MHVLHDAAEEIDEESDASKETVDAGDVRPTAPAGGLHAKLYIADDGWDAHVWTGSANATDAAFVLNVEFLVQLTGKKSKQGVEATLAGESGSGLRTLLAPFTLPDAPVVESEVDRALAKVLRDANHAISTVPWLARTERSSAAGETEMYTVSLLARGGAVGMPPGCSARVWPIALQQDRAVSLDTPWKAVSRDARFSRLRPSSPSRSRHRLVSVSSGLSSSFGRHWKGRPRPLRARTPLLAR